MSQDSDRYNSWGIWARRCGWEEDNILPPPYIPLQGIKYFVGVLYNVFEVGEHEYEVQSFKFFLDQTPGEAQCLRRNR